MKTYLFFLLLTSFSKFLCRKNVTHDNHRNNARRIELTPQELRNSVPTEKKPMTKYMERIKAESSSIESVSILII